MCNHLMFESADNEKSGTTEDINNASGIYLSISIIGRTVVKTQNL